MINKKKKVIHKKIFILIFLFSIFAIFTSCTYKYDLIIRNTSKFPVSVTLQFKLRLNNAEYDFIENNETKNKIKSEQNSIINELRVIKSSNTFDKIFYNTDYWLSLQQGSIISRNDESITIQLLPNTSLFVDYLLNSRPTNSSHFRSNPLHNWDKIIILTTPNFIEYDDLKIIDMFNNNCRDHLFYYTI